MQPKQRGTVFFDTQPHGARIYVDGQLLIDPDTEESLRTPERVAIFEGRRDYTFVLEGHKDVHGYVDIYPGTTVSIFRNMEPGKSEGGWGEPEPQIWLGEKTGAIDAYSEPDGADVYIDELPILDQSGNIVTTPVTITDISDGIRQITFVMDGYFNETRSVDVDFGEYSEVMVKMKRSYSKHR